MAIILPFQPKRRPQPLPLRESCRCCLGRSAHFFVHDSPFCATCDAFIRAGEIVPASVGYEPATEAAAMHLADGFEMYDAQSVAQS